MLVHFGNNSARYGFFSEPLSSAASREHVHTPRVKAITGEVHYLWRLG